MMGILSSVSVGQTKDIQKLSKEKKGVVEYEHMFHDTFLTQRGSKQDATENY